MGPQTALPRTILLLLFLYLSEGGRSHPLGRPDQASDQSGIQVSETQPEHVTPEPRQQGRLPTEAWKAKKAAPKSTLQAFRGVQMPKVKQDSSCFGRTRMDRIDSVSGLGCKVLRRP
ncbi:PREDICTED: natriuretic peptides B [Chinchilla lanigera]|uniref:natriuretic peptides B n=1 Tax=Chinchilla lanigera TaxID=34839 RepID=UPI00038E94C1|nr:PREDICTED: natriuretic peptides B [Chinchilla lanigera]